jgi:hypothetical protein
MRGGFGVDEGVVHGDELDIVTLDPRFGADEGVVHGDELDIVTLQSGCVSEIQNMRGGCVSGF